MRTIILLIMSLTLTGCVTFEPKYKFDTWDKILYSGAQAANIADGITTAQALNDPENYETNTLTYGSDPSDAQLIAGKILGAIALHYLAKELTPGWRKTALGAGMLWFGYAAHSNYKLMR